jgi:LmbE family N-acetylglucosaminyl deacetylase
MPRALLVFAHPDDEIVALGARIARFAQAHMVHVTDGAPRNEHDSRAHGFASFKEYRAARVSELNHALRIAGLENMSRECLNIPDQQASLRLLQLTCDLLRRIEMHQPEVLFTHPYEGGHPDHDACAFAVHQAAQIHGRRTTHTPVIMECTLYHSGPNGISTGAFLPQTPSLYEVVHALSPEEQARKQARVACFTTQRDTLSWFSFDEERFRIAPTYDFTRPPHPAPVWYDRFPWGMTSDSFSWLAAEAERALSAEPETACR